jgi:hypothetical protein
MTMVKKKKKRSKRPTFSVPHEVTLLDKRTGHIQVLIVSKDVRIMEGLYKELADFLRQSGRDKLISVLLVPN